MRDGLSDAHTSPRALGWGHASLVTVGAMVGSGIFTTPAEVARRTGSTRASLVVWVVGGALSLLGALCVAELGAAYPASGGLYVYLRRAFGPRVAFVFGWAMTAVLVPSSVAFYARVTAQHLAPWLGGTVPGWSLALLASIAAVNLWGVRPTAWLQSGVTALRALGLLAVAVLAARLPAGGASVVRAHGAGASLAALVPVLWAYDGWIDVTSVAGEMKHPARDVPRSLVGGTLAVIALYLVTAWSFDRCLGTAALGASEAPAVAVGARLGGDAGRAAMGLLVASSTFGGSLIALWTGTRVVGALGDDVAPWRRWFVTSSRGVPVTAVALTTALAMAYTLSSWAGRLAEIFVVGAWPFYALGAAATVVLRRRDPSTARPFRTPWFPWTSVAFLVVTLAMLAVFAVQSPAQVLGSLAVIALGAPLGWWATRRAG